jgi:glucosamine--fructose-6-phosphate aminotransferase (isomerizing)
VSRTLLEREIAEQPAVVEQLLHGQRGTIAEAAARARATDTSWVLIAARGTSDNAARYAQHVLGLRCGMPVALATPSLTTLYRAPLRLDGALVMGISQSGESPDVCAVVEAAQAAGRPTIAITNTPGSVLARAADTTIGLGAGPERSVAATKTYTASLAAIAALAVELAGDEALHEQLARMPEAMAQQLAGQGDVMAGDALAGVERCAVIGRGPNRATAFEAALKIKELTAIAAEPYSPADLMHGPVAVLGPATPLLAIAVDGPALPSVIDAVTDARRRGAGRLVLSDVSGDRFGAEEVVPLVSVPEWLSPLVSILPAQALAARLAGERGIDVDAPFGLSKVTRTI